MKVHFVCEGNNFRSRLAEAILNSKKINHIDVISSGVRAKLNKWGPISWDTARLLKNHNLIDYMSNMWQQTSKELLNASDMVFFMEKLHYLYCKNHLDFTSSHYEIWNIKDTILDTKPVTTHIDEDIKAIQESEKTFLLLESKVDKFIREFR